MIGGLVLVVTLVGITALSGSVKGVFVGFQSDMEDKVAYSEEMSANNLSSIKSLNALNPNIKGGTTGIESSIQTLGANGTTEFLASQLTKISNLLQKNEDISPEEAQILLNLANAGHKLAAAQALTVQYVDLYKDQPEKLETVKIHFDGVTYTGLVDFTRQIGTAGLTPESLFKVEESLTLARSGKLLKPFYELALKTKTISLGKEASELVQEAVEGIMYTAESVEHTVRASRGKLKGTILDSDTLPAKTDGESAVICTAGNNSDNGSNCAKKKKNDDDDDDDD